MRRALRSPIACLALACWLLPATAHASGDLVLIPDWRMMLTLIVLFLLLIAPAHQLIFKPLLRVLDERDERTQGTRARAARIEEEAREVLARYEREIEKTREDAERQRRTTLEQVRGESQQLTGQRAQRRRAESGQCAPRAGERAGRRARRAARSRPGARARSRSRVLGRPL